jgi:predicted kinase
MLMSAEPNGFIPGAPWLLLVGGAPASGKTQLARQLAARYGALLCAKDQIKEVLFDTLGTGPEAAPAAMHASSGTTARWSRRLSDASFALMFQLIPSLLHAQRPVLLEGNFRPGEHEAAVTALLSGGRARLIQILCYASIATRAARLAARAGDPTRHPAHQDARIDVYRTAPSFLALPGERLCYDSDLEPQRAFEPLCRELDARLAAL